MIREYATPEKADAVAHEALWLAWIAAGGPRGMGFMQDRSKATKEDVIKNVCTAGDYPGAKVRSDKFSADYVFGRMIKLYIRKPSATSLDIFDMHPRRDYQSWCGTFSTYAALFDAAEKSVGVSQVAPTSPSS